MIQISRKHNDELHDPDSRSPEQDRCHAPPSRKSVPTAPRPPPEPSVTSHGMEYRALFGQVGSAPPPSCAPSWSPVKINPVLAKPRTGGRSLFKAPWTLSAGLGTGVCELVPSSVTPFYEIGQVSFPVGKLRHRTSKANTWQGESWVLVL